MAIIMDPQPELLAWAEARTPTGYPFRTDARAIGLVTNADLVAVLVFDTFSPWDCQTHICAEGRRWFAPDLWRAGAAFAFLQCGYGRISAQISVANRRALALARAAGFEREGVLAGAGMNQEGMVMFGMLASRCRWLPRTIGMPRATRQGRREPL